MYLKTVSNLHSSITRGPHVPKKAIVKIYIIIDTLFCKEK